MLFVTTNLQKTKLMYYHTDSLPNRFMQTSDNQYLWFSGTSYLGMGHSAVLRENLLEGISRYGTSWGSSRNNTIQLAIFEDAEYALAQFTEAPACLTASSGMMAGQIVMRYLENLPMYSSSFSIGQTIQYFYAPKVHPAVWGRGYEPSSLTHRQWSEKIVETVQRTNASEIIIATDSVGSPFVESFDFEWITKLPTNKSITVVVDDSHGFGVFGDNGKGIFAELFAKKPDNVRLIVVASLNKAMAISAGIILSDFDTIVNIRSTPFFSGSSPAMPAGLYAYVNSQEEYVKSHQKLMENIAYFNEVSPKNNTLFTSIPRYPAFCTYQAGLHDYLKENGIMTACFSYPTAQDKPVTRLVMSALHEKSDLELLGGLLDKY
jgi:8-amino-7-oxononanoate synthase